jgi:hypothetical protein
VESEGESDTSWYVSIYPSRSVMILTAYWPSVRSVLWNIRPRFFNGMDRATKERGPCKKQRSDISQYRPNKRGQ